MRLLLLLPLLVLLSSCASRDFNDASQREILSRAQAELSMRENWYDYAYIQVREQPSFKRFVWRVRAGAFDHSDYPNYRGANLIPGTERELVFSESGCLIGYHRRGPCGPLGDQRQPVQVYEEDLK